MLTRLQVVRLGAWLSYLIPEVGTCTISILYCASQGLGVLRVPEVHHHVVVFLSAFFNLAENQFTSGPRFLQYRYTFRPSSCYPVLCSFLPLTHWECI
jgi:hypothetical protein